MAKSRSQDPISQPFVNRKFILGSSQSQKVFSRNFGITSEALYNLGILVRIIGTEEQAKDVEAVVDDMLSQVSRELQEETARLEKLLDENGISGTVSFSHPLEGEVQITSPRAGRLFGLICEMDKLIGRMTMLWISGVLLDAQYSAGTFQWQRRLIKVTARIQNIARRAMNSARTRRAPAGKSEGDGEGLDTAGVEQDQEKAPLADGAAEAA